MYFRDLDENGYRAEARAAEAPVAARDGLPADVEANFAAVAQVLARLHSEVEALRAEVEALRAERNGGVRRLEDHEPIAFVIEGGA